MAEMDVNRERRGEGMESNRRCFETRQVQFGEDLRRARDGEMEKDGGDGYDGDDNVDMMDVDENQICWVYGGMELLKERRFTRIY